MSTALAAFPIPSGTSIRAMDRDAWLAARLLGIGASEIADVCGFGYGTPLSVYLRKTGQIPPLEESLAMRIGTLAEPVIRQLYEETTGREVTREQVFVHAPEFPGLFATVDAVNDRGRPVEFKCVGHRSAHLWGAAGTDEVPPHYLLQATQQMMLVGTDSIEVAALLGTDFRVYEVPRDQAAERMIVRRAAEFLDALERRIPPEPSEPSDVKLLVALHPEAEGEIEFLPDVEADAALWLDLGARIKADATARDLARLRLEAAMAGASLGWLADGRGIRRRVQTQAAGEFVTRRQAKSWTVITEVKAKGKGAGRGDDE